MYRMNRGFSLVEILVGMIVGLLTVIIIMQVLSVSENQKRTTTGGSDTQMSSNIAMHTLAREIQVAGHGLTVGDGIGCVTATYDNNVVPPMGQTRPVPLLITDGGAGSDTITVMFSTGSVTTSYNFTTTSSADAPIALASNVGIKVGDIIQIVDDPVSTCTLAQVTAVTAPPNPSISRAAGAGPCTATNCAANSQLNRNGGLGVNYSASAHVFNLGRLATNTYYVAGQNLVVDSTVTGTVSTLNTLIASNVVALQAQYGVDDGAAGGTANDDIIDEWVDATGVWAAIPPPAVPSPATALLRQIKAVRIALVARNSQIEKADAAGQCNATPVAVIPIPWPAAPAPTGPAMTVNLAATAANWGCYRYKVYESVIPLRNVIWG